MCDQGCSSVRSARLFPVKETGAGWRTQNGQADRLLLSRWVGWLPQGNDIELASITWVVTVRAAERESYLRVNHRRSGVTLKARVTWGAVNDSLCTVFSTLAIRGGQATRPQDFVVENGIGRVRNPVVSSGRLGALDFLGEVHPNSAALQPCLDGPAWKADH